MVAAFVSNNPVPKGELPALIQTIHATFARLSSGVEDPTPKEEPKEPAVSIRKSITPEYLICLEDGKGDRPWTVGRKGRSAQTRTPAEGHSSLAKDI